MNPGSSNMSSLERGEDFAPTGVSCSITCMSDITEWDTALDNTKEKRMFFFVFLSVTYSHRQEGFWHIVWRAARMLLPSVAKAHAQPFRLLLLLSSHALDFLLLHFPVNLQLLVGQAHGGHTAEMNGDESEHSLKVQTALLLNIKLTTHSVWVLHTGISKVLFSP